jgi:hypothetical protein
LSPTTGVADDEELARLSDFDLMGSHIATQPPTDVAAIDMFVVATATFRLLYTLIVLGHDEGLFTSRSPRIRRKPGSRIK